MSRGMKGVLTLAVVVALHQAVVMATGKAMPMGGGDMAAPKSPAEMARESYNSGIEHKDKGKKLEVEFASQMFRNAKDEEKALSKIKDEYTKGLKDFKKAAELDPTLYQAFNGMGFTLRKTGEPVKALEMYDKALQMAPGFPDAMEYRGEAYLALGRMDDAKQSYLQLFAKDRTQADVLMGAMKAFVAKPAAGVDPAAVASLDAWIKERSKIAQVTHDMGLRSNRSVWK